MNPNTLRIYWRGIARSIYGIDADFDEAYIPPLPQGDGHWRYLGIPNSLTKNQAAVGYRKLLREKDWDLSSYTHDLDKSIVWDARTTKASYFICVRADHDGGPDQQYLGKTAQEADREGKIGETLIERLIHGSIYFLETGKILDEKWATLCTGSELSGGRIPCVYWGDRAQIVYVRWYGIHRSGKRCGLREARVR